MGTTHSHHALLLMPLLCEPHGMDPCRRLWPNRIRMHYGATLKAVDWEGQEVTLEVAGERGRGGWVLLGERCHCQQPST